MIKIMSKDNDLLGTDRYRDDDKLKPLAFRPTIDHTVNVNNTGTNHNVTVRTNYPVIVEVNGVTTSKDSFLAVTKFSALQHIISDVERAKCLDKHIEFLTKAKESILAGQLPDSPIVLTA